MSRPSVISGGLGAFWIDLSVAASPVPDGIRFAAQWLLIVVAAISDQVTVFLFVTALICRPKSDALNQLMQRFDCWT